MPLAKLILNLGLLISSWTAAVAETAGLQAEVKATRADTQLIVQVIPPTGTHLNFDGPWKLEVKGELPLVKKDGVFHLDAFDKTAGRFALPLERKASTSEHGDYTLTYFFCAADNSWCRRAQTTGKL